MPKLGTYGSVRGVPGNRHPYRDHRHRGHARDETIAWLLWYNCTRLHSTLAYVSPMRFEQDWLANQGKPIRDSVLGYGFQGQGHSSLEIQPPLSPIPRWTRLPIGKMGNPHIVISSFLLENRGKITRRSGRVGSDRIERRGGAQYSLVDVEDK